MIGHLVAMLVSAVAFFGAILLYGAFSPRRLKGWKFWLCFAVYCALMEGGRTVGKRALFRLRNPGRRCGPSNAL